MRRAASTIVAYHNGNPVRLDAIAQVNLGVRKHRNRSLLQLGVMARQILAARKLRDFPGKDGALARLEELKAKIISGEIQVPRKSASRLTITSA